MACIWEDCASNLSRIAAYYDVFLAFPRRFRKILGWYFWLDHGCFLPLFPFNLQIILPVDNIPGVTGQTSLGCPTLGGTLDNSRVCIYKVQRSVATLFIAWENATSTFCWQHKELLLDLESAKPLVRWNIFSVFVDYLFLFNGSRLLTVTSLLSLQSLLERHSLSALSASCACVLFVHGTTTPSGPGPHPYRGFTTTLRHITFGRTPLGKWSARRRDLCLTTQHL